jgi:FixJ family two-component response regulator
MNGRELSDALRALYPNLKVLFMSGYTADAVTCRGTLGSGVNFMQKPFSLKTLAVKTGKALGKGISMIDPSAAR